MDEDLAETIANSDLDLDDAEALLDRWDGRPDRVIEDVFRVRDLETKEVSDLELTPYQRQFVHAVWYGEASTTAVLKGRRTGYSFIACATILLHALVTPHSFHAITGPSKSQAKDRIDDIYDLMDWSRLEFDNIPTDNTDEIELPNGATMMAFAGNPDTSRGADSADILFIDEMDFLEDQEESMRAFSPFVALGDAQTIEISTPKRRNSLFMEDVERGSPEGEDGIIAIEQPAFENPEVIDINESLLEQDVEPVMPYLNLEEAEKDRQRDPNGFAQEYLCQTVSDEYRFFTEDGIIRAQQRGAETIQNGEARGTYTGYSPATHAREGGKMVMGVDIGIDRDDTAIAVFEHAHGHRWLRWHTLLDKSDLYQAGLGHHEDVDNPTAVADYVNFVAENMSIDRVFLDKTGPGKGFQKEIEKRLGRKAVGFNFTDLTEVERMMGDFNYGLHNDLITLVPDDTIFEQLKAIVKEQRHESSKPKFSGKEHSPSGKDDLAMAMVLGAYPPNFDADRTEEPHKRTDAHEFDDATEDDTAEGSESWRGVVQRNNGEAPRDTADEQAAIPGLNTGNGRTDSDYNRRHSRDSSH